MRISLLLVMAVLLASCCEPKRIAVPLQSPPPLNNYTEKQLEANLGECVSDKTYIDIIDTYRRVDTLTGIINSTNIQH